MTVEAERRARAVAQRQGGVLTRAQALAAGLRPAEVETALRQGRWTRTRHGAYAVAGPPEDDRAALARLVAAAQLRTPGLVALGRTAAALHGLPLLGPATGLVQARPRAGQRRHDVPRVHLPDDHVTVLGAVRVTTLARTVVDVARTGTLLQGVVVADAGLHRGVTAGELEQVRDSCRQSPGSRAAAVALGRARRGSESPLESLGRLRLVDGGLPEPEL